MALTFNQWSSSSLLANTGFRNFAINENYCYVPDGVRTFIFNLDGTVYKQLTNGTAATACAITDSNLYVLLNGRYVYKYDLLGTLVTANFIDIGGADARDMFIYGNHFYFATWNDGCVYIFNVSDGQGVKNDLITALGNASGVFIRDSIIYVSSFGSGGVYGTGTGRIGKYNLDGTVINANLITGLTLPYRCFVFNSSLYVHSDAALKLYNTSGTYISAGESPLLSPIRTVAISIDKQGHLYLAQNSPSGTKSVYKSSTSLFPPPTLTNFPNLTKVFGDASFSIVPPTSNSSGAFTYTSSNTNVASINGSTITIVNAGTVTITATQAASGNYSGGSINLTLTVSKAVPTITQFLNISKIVGDVAFSLTQPTSNSTGAFTFLSSNINVATINGSTVTLGSAGTSTITATQASTDNYESATISLTLTVTKKLTTLSAFSDITKTYQEADFALTQPTSNSTGAFTYISSNTNVATINGSSVTIINAGSSTITATQADTNEYESGSISLTLTVLKKTPTLTVFSDINKTYQDTAFDLTQPTSSSNGAFTYASSNANVATINGSTVTLLNAGTATITATQAATSNYESATISLTLTVSKKNPNLSVFSDINKTYQDAAFSLTTPTSASNGAFTYTSSNSNVATINGSTLTLLNAGTATITATQAATDNYESATITLTLTVSKKIPTLSVFSDITKTYQDAAFSLTTPTSASNGAFTFVSSNSNSATIDGSTVTLLNAGTATITATQAATSNYESATITLTLTVSKKIPTLSDFSDITKTYQDAAFTLTQPSSNSNGGFRYESSNINVATNKGGTVTLLNAGSTTITATQAETINYESATISLTLTVSKKNPNLSVFLDITKTYQDADFVLTQPTSVSSGAFTYTSLNTSIATISGSTVTLLNAGSTTITATQAATDNYESATISLTLTVSKKNPNLSVFSDITKTYQDAAFSLTAPTSASNGAFSYVSANTNVATISGSTVTLLNAGSTTITATQEATDNYESGTISLTLTVSKKNPTLSAFSDITKTYQDAAFSLTAPTSLSNGAFTYLSSNTNIATISGSTLTLLNAGTATITATQAATDNYESASISLTLTVSKKTPTLSVFSDITKTYGDAAFSLTTPTSASNGVFTYTSLNTNSATINGSTVTILNAGSTTINATQAETINYESASISLTLTVSKNVPTLSIFSDITKTYQDAVFTLTQPTSSSNGTFTYTSLNTTVATISGSNVTLLNAGTATITATQEATSNYESGSISLTLTVSKKNPDLSVFSDITKTYEDAVFSLTAPTSSSNGAFTYTSLNTTVATISGSTVTLLNAGTATITATQAATINYESGSISLTLTVLKKNPTLSAFSDMTKTFGDEPFTLTQPTSNSTGAFTYSSSNASMGKITGSTVTILNAGTVTITATQASTSNYLSGTIQMTLVLSQKVPSISQFPDITKTYGDAAFTLTRPTSNSAAAFTYTSLNTSVATITGTTVTILNAGTATITATQPAKDNYKSGSISLTLTVSKQNPPLSVFSDINKIYGDAAFSLTQPTSSSNGAFTYTSLNTSVAIISGSTVTLLAAGTATITATQAATSNYESGSISLTLTVSKKTPTLSIFSDITKTYGDTAFSLTQPTSSSNGAFTFLSSNTDVATISGSTVTLLNAGTATITATQATTSNYESATISLTLTVSKKNPILSVFSDINKIYGDAAFSLTQPTSSSNGAFTYTSLNTAIATISGSTVTLLNAGIATITATQAATNNYESGSISLTLTVSKKNPTLSVFSDITKTYGDAAFSLTQPTSSSNGAFTYTSLNTTVASINGSTVTLLSAGTATITATQASTSNYESGSISLTLTVSKQLQNLSQFININKTFGDAAFSLTQPTSSSNGAFTYTSSNTSVATINGITVTIINAGSTTITATQAATDNYESESISLILTVAKKLPTLSVFSDMTKTYGDAVFSLTPPISSSDGAFTYSSLNTSVATINGSTVTILNAGSTTITATQSATDNYESGSISLTLTVSKKLPNLSVFSDMTKTYGDAAFSLTPPISSSNGAFTYSSLNTSVATINGSTVTILNAGSTTITATQAATDNYESGSIQMVLTISKKIPNLSVFSDITKTYGDAAFSMTAPTSLSNGAFTYSSLNTAVATINGSTVTILNAGTATITATQAATSNYESGSISLTLTVSKKNPNLSVFLDINKIYQDADFSLTAPTSLSNGAFTYSSLNSAVATINGNTVTVLNAGSTTITATQAATSNYESATISLTLTVSKKNPTLSVFSDITKTYQDAAFSLTTPTSSSNGTFTYSSLNSAVATINGSTVTILNAGTSTITATQASTSNYESGTISLTLTVSKKNPFLSVFSDITKTYQDAAFSLSAPTSSSNGAFTYSSLDTAIATINGSTVTILNAGSTTITAMQAATDNYESGSISLTLTISKKNPILSVFSDITKTYQDAAFSLTAPTSSSNGAFTYTSLNTNVATINGNTVTVLNAGSTTITAQQASTSNFESGSVSLTLTVSKKLPNLSQFLNIDKMYRDADFSLIEPTSSSNGAFTYTSLNTNVATINGSTVTVLNAGTSTITATQAATNNYESGSISLTLTVSRNILSITQFPDMTKTFGDANFTLTQPTSNSTGAFTYTSSNIAVAAINGNTVTIVKAGTVTITATQAATSNYESGTIQMILNISKKTPNLSVFSDITKTYGDAAFSLTSPTSNSNGSFGYVSSNTTIATINGSSVTILNAGTTTITAEQSSTDNYESGSISLTLTISKQVPIITQFFDITKTYGDAAFSMTTPNSDSNGAFTYSSLNTTVATINGSTVTLLNAGTATITATQAATSNYESGSISLTLTVSKKNPNITQVSDIAKKVGDAAFTLTAPTSTSTGSFTYTSLNTIVATINGNTVTLLNAGTATITAAQEATSNYETASIQLTLTVSKNTPTITQFLDIFKTNEDVDFVLTQPTSTSNGTFTYTSSNTSVATINGSTITIINAGTATITAQQAETDNYTSVTKTSTLTVLNLTNITNFFLSVQASLTSAIASLDVATVKASLANTAKNAAQTSAESAASAALLNPSARAASQLVLTAATEAGAQSEASDSALSEATIAKTNAQTALETIETAKASILSQPSIAALQAAEEQSQTATATATTAATTASNAATNASNAAGLAQAAATTAAIKETEALTIASAQSQSITIATNALIAAQASLTVALQAFGQATIKAALAVNAKNAAQASAASAATAAIGYPSAELAAQASSLSAAEAATQSLLAEEALAEATTAKISTQAAVQIAITAKASSLSETSLSAAQEAAIQAQTAASDAETAATQTQTAATNVLNAANLAQAAATTAAIKETEALVELSALAEAKTAATNALISAQASFESATLCVNDATIQAALAVDAKNAAQASAQTAAESAFRQAQAQIAAQAASYAAAEALRQSNLAAGALAQTIAARDSLEEALEAVEIAKASAILQTSATEAQTLATQAQTLATQAQTSATVAQTYLFFTTNAKTNAQTSATIAHNKSMLAQAKETDPTNIPLHIALGNICFLAGTLIETDQGLVEIDKLDINIHTIRSKNIKAITCIVSVDKHLICFEKNSLAENIPSERTIISLNHMVCKPGTNQMFEAYKYLKSYATVKKIRYDGELLYNILLEKHEIIKVNNMVCETLHPNNIIAKLFSALSILKEEDTELKTAVIEMFNNYVKRKTRLVMLP